MRLGPFIPLVACWTNLLLASASASSYTTLYHFTGRADGGIPSGGVIRGVDGTLYGQTSAGGTAPCTTKRGLPRNGCGTVYSLGPSGTFTILASFHGANGAYGASRLTLVQSVLIGATTEGGASDDGVVYAVKTDGSRFTLVHQFSGLDGIQPIGPLIPGSGVFYGITSGGGPGYPAQSNGVLFSLTTSGKYTILHSFSAVDGINPSSLRGTSSGTLVGSTFFGGPTNPDYCPAGCGVVFSYDPGSRKYTVLKTYDGLMGTDPYVGSVGSDGTIYGNDSNLFSINSAGLYQILGQSNTYIGSQPASGPALVPRGSLYGTYTENAPVFNGSLYSYIDGVFASAYVFGDDGTHPTAEPTITPTGSVIGTLNYDGLCGNCGTIYQYTP